jgi:uncharacterized membrane-anchored protein
MTRLRSSTPVRLAVACALSAALVPLAVWPQLSARLTGDTYDLAVTPVDPIDPFRGAYVTLDYPGLAQAQPTSWTGDDDPVFVPLRRTDGSDVWTGGRALREAPASGPYLRCDAGQGRLRCGIESLFASQDDARRLERDLADGGAVARVRVDGRGNAAVVGLRPGA